MAQLFKENAGRSIYLSGSALVLSLLIAMPLGIAQAVRRNSIGDYTMTTLTFVLYAMPPFFLGRDPDRRLRPAPARSSRRWSPDSITTTGGAITHPRDFVLPIVTLTAVNIAVVQPLHALIGAGQPGSGLHPTRSRQGAARSEPCCTAICCATRACR